MAEGKVRFIRVKGRVVPIRENKDFGFKKSALIGASAGAASSFTTAAETLAKKIKNPKISGYAAKIAGFKKPANVFAGVALIGGAAYGIKKTITAKKGDKLKTAAGNLVSYFAGQVGGTFIGSAAAGLSIAVPHVALKRRIIKSGLKVVKGSGVER